MASAFVLFGDQSCAAGSLTGTDPARSQPTNHACAHRGWLCSFTLAANSLTAECVHRRVIGGHRALVPLQFPFLPIAGRLEGWEEGHTVNQTP